MSQPFPPDFGPSDPHGMFPPPPPPPGARMPAQGGWLPLPPPPPRGPMMMPARRGGSLLRMLVAGVVGLILIDLVLLNIGIIGAVKSSSSLPEPRQVTLVDEGSKNIIASVPVDGLITEATAAQFDECLTGVEKDKTVKALVLEIDTPGGSATASDQMYHRVLRFKKLMQDQNRSMPVVVSMGGMATSGGYYLACSGDSIWAQPQTMTANIGVIMPRFNIYDLMNKYGVKESTIVASGCDYKNAGSMFSPEDAKSQAYLQGLVDATFQQFKDVVNAGRGGKLKGDAAEIFNGRVYMAADAMRLGLIDKVGYREEAYAYAKSVAGLTSMKVVSFEPTQSFFGGRITDAVSGIAGGSASSSSNITINGIHVDARSLSELLSPRPLYLFGL